jgi:hypothetical protein
MIRRKRAGLLKPSAPSAGKSPRRKKTPICPECGFREVIPVLHNPITQTQQRAIDSGRAILADREEWEGMTEWYCKSCGCDWGRHSRRFKKPGGVNATRSNH